MDKWQKCPLIENCQQKSAVCNVQLPDETCYWFRWFRALDNPWHTGMPTETGEYLVCIRYDFGKEGYTTANYVEPYNPHTGWYNLKPPSEEDGHEWCKKKGIEVIAWQKIEPYKEKEDGSGS